MFRRSRLVVVRAICSAVLISCSGNSEPGADTSPDPDVVDAGGDATDTDDSYGRDDGEIDADEETTADAPEADGADGDSSPDASTDGGDVDHDADTEADADGPDANATDATDTDARPQDGDGDGAEVDTTDVPVVPPGCGDGDVDDDEECDDGNLSADDGCDGACRWELCDDGEPWPTWYVDEDRDGFGVGDEGVYACDPPEPEGWASATGDCAPADRDVSPGAQEICDDETDNDCDPSNECSGVCGGVGVPSGACTSVLEPWAGPAPALHWTFEADTLGGTTVTDLSGAGADGTAVGGVVFRDDSLRDSGVAALNGIDAHIDAAPTRSGSFTVAHWVRPSVFPESGTFVIASMGRGAIEFTGWRTALEPDLGVSVVTDGGSDGRTVHTAATACLDRWVHVVAAVGEGVARLFVNGELRAESELPYSAAVLGDVGFSLGWDPLVGRRYLQGRVDEVVYWDGVLADEEIVEVYHRAACGAGYAAE